jgi:hypothetical protein
MRQDTGGGADIGEGEETGLLKRATMSETEYGEQLTERDR